MEHAKRQLSAGGMKESNEGITEIYTDNMTVRKEQSRCRLDWLASREIEARLPANRVASHQLSAIGHAGTEGVQPYPPLLEYQKCPQ